MPRETEAPQFAQSIADVSFKGFVNPGTVDNSAAIKTSADTALLGQIAQSGMDAWKGYELAKVENETEEVIKEYTDRREGSLPFSQSTKDALQPILQDHLGDISKLQNAYEQGAMSKAEFVSRMTSVTKDATNRAPGFYPDIINHSKKVLELSGISQIIDADEVANKATADQFNTYSKNVVDAAEANDIPVDYAQVRNPNYLPKLNRLVEDAVRVKQNAAILKQLAEGRSAANENEVRDFIDSGALAEGISGTLKNFSTSALESSHAVSSKGDYAEWVTNLSLAKDNILREYSLASAKYADNANVKEQMKVFTDGLESVIENISKFTSKEEAAKYLQTSIDVMNNADEVAFRQTIGMGKQQLDVHLKLANSPNLVTLFKTGKSNIVSNIINNLSKVVTGVTDKKTSTGRPIAEEVFKGAATGEVDNSAQSLINKYPLAVEKDSRAVQPQEAFKLQDGFVFAIADPLYLNGVEGLDEAGKTATLRVLGKYTDTILGSLTSNLGEVADRLTALPNGELTMGEGIDVEDASRYTARINKAINAYANVLQVSPKQAAEEFIYPKIFGTPFEGGALEKPKDKELTISQGAMAHEEIVQVASDATGVDSTLLLAQIDAESRGNVKATSHAGAQGVSQFMPATAKQFGVDVTSAESSIDGQARYMKQLISKFDGDEEKALAGYNAGPTRVARIVKKHGDKWKDHLPSETKEYIRRIQGKRKNRPL